MNDLLQESTSTISFRRTKEFLRRGLFNNFALIHEDNPVCDLACKTHLMSHAQHCHPLPGKRGHYVQDLIDHFRIERRSRLIKKHNLRCHAECTCNRDALLLSAR